MSCCFLILHRNKKSVEQSGREPLLQFGTEQLHSECNVIAGPAMQAHTLEQGWSLHCRLCTRVYWTLCVSQEQCTGLGTQGLNESHTTTPVVDCFCSNVVYSLYPQGGWQLILPILLRAIGTNISRAQCVSSIRCRFSSPRAGWRVLCFVASLPPSLLPPTLPTPCHRSWWWGLPASWRYFPFVNF